MRIGSRSASSQPRASRGLWGVWEFKSISRRGVAVLSHNGQIPVRAECYDGKSGCPVTGEYHDGEIPR